MKNKKKLKANNWIVKSLEVLLYAVGAWLAVEQFLVYFTSFLSKDCTWGYSNEYWMRVSYSWNASPCLQKALIASSAFIVEGISKALIVWGIWYILKILRLYQKNIFFSQEIITLYHKTARLAFIWTLYAPLEISILNMLESLQNPVGQRFFALTIGTNDIYNIAITGILYVIAFAMVKAYALKKEHDLVV